MHVRGFPVWAALLAVVACGGAATPATTRSEAAPDGTRFAFTVDRIWDRATQPAAPSEAVPDSGYRAQEPRAAYLLVFDAAPSMASRVTVLSMEGEPSMTAELEPAQPASERRFALRDGAFAGGRLSVRGSRATLTVYGSGVPVVSTVQGQLAAVR